ncbi:protein transport protein Sft2p [Diutina catenulata]
MSAENNFRQSFANWNQRSGAGSVPASGSRPVLSDWTDYVRSGASNLYSSLPTSAGGAEPAQEPGWFQLSRVERLVGFAACLGASALCFVICFFMFPVLALRPRKFGILWTMGSLLFVVSFGVLQGPVAYTRHLFSAHRVVFTSVFFGSVLMTLWSAVVLKSSIMTIICSVVELFAVAYYLVSYFPFGASAMTFFSSYVMGYLGGFIGAIF